MIYLFDCLQCVVFKCALKLTELGFMVEKQSSPLLLIEPSVPVSQSWINGHLPPASENDQVRKEKKANQMKCLDLKETHSNYLKHLNFK